MKYYRWYLWLSSSFWQSCTPVYARMQIFHSTKRQGRPQMTTATATSSQRNLGFHIKDEITGTLFLVDTGTFCSVYPAAPHERHIVDTDPLLLTAASGTAISLHGTKDIQLQFNSRKYT